ncbi:hypothetical protein [Alkalicoccus urumqiensis]|uniref:hypothetical protein n=1 Tax=Alkalicoccus urumqiensis TaxID=1548213 RepID=UPI0015E5D71E|nr:hypothetical protein [Alkalicoccus urumqiensis]
MEIPEHLIKGMHLTHGMSFEAYQQSVERKIRVEEAREDEYQRARDTVRRATATLR